MFGKTRRAASFATSFHSGKIVISYADDNDNFRWKYRRDRDLIVLASLFFGELRRCVYGRIFPPSPQAKAGIPSTLWNRESTRPAARCSADYAAGGDANGQQRPPPLSVPYIRQPPPVKIRCRCRYCCYYCCWPCTVASAVLSLLTSRASVDRIDSTAPIAPVDATALSSR